MSCRTILDVGRRREGQGPGLFRVLAHPAQRILERRSKGGPDGFANQIISVHRAEIIDRLTSGLLARQKIIDCDAIVSTLCNDAPNLGTDQARLLSLVDTEAWVAHWSP
jgi:asparagine synthase (glutamine-hydrolysing)